MRPPQASPAVERACVAISTVGGLWFAFTAWWGMAAIPMGGHLGNGSAGTAMLGATGLKWHSVYPLFDWFNPVNPYPGAASCHHPFGIFWLSAIVIAIFGHHDWVVNLPASIMSSLLPIVLYKLGKHCWGPVSGMAAVLGFVLLPLTVGYSLFHGLEGMTIFGACVFYLGSARYQTWGRRRDLVLAVFGALFCTSGDWAGYLAIAPVLLWAFFRTFVMPTWMTPAVHTMRYHRWWALSVAAALFTAMLWVALFQRADKIGEWLQMAETRGGGKDIPLATVLETRKAWIEFSFTPFAIQIGKLAAFLALARFAWKRVDHELFSLAMLFGATVQYVVFKRGADVHIFWPHYFGAYFALAMAQVAATAWDLGALVVRKLQPERGWIAPALALTVVLVPAAIMTPDAVRSLKIWRETGGRYDDKGALIRTHADLLFVMKEIIHPQLHPLEHVGVDGGANVGWEHSWSLQADLTDSPVPNDFYPFWVARASSYGADRLKRALQTHTLAIYGDILLWTRGSSVGPVNAYSLGEHEPNLFQWMFTNNVEPVRSVPVAPDPYLTWEWRVHLDEPATEPIGAPRTIDELRIAHNIAVFHEDAATAERLREQIVAQLAREPETHFEGGHELMGVRITHGVQPTLETWFEAGGPTPNETHFQVRSHIVRRARFTLVPIDETDREMAWPAPLSTKLWKKGFIYKFECVMNHRIGLEAYSGGWVGGPARRGGRDAILLAQVE